MAFTNGEIKPIYQQGVATGDGGRIIYMPERGNNASISALNFNGGSFSLYRGTKTTGEKILLYEFNLDLRDVVSDTVGYHLDGHEKTDGDYFWLVPQASYINFTIEGLEYEKNTIQPPFGTSGSISVIDQYGQPKVRCCSGGGGYEYDCIDDTITEETNTYQNDKLIGAIDLKICIIDKQLFTEIDGDYTFDNITGTITTVSVTMYFDSTIVVPFNRKL